MKIQSINTKLQPTPQNLQDLNVNTDLFSVFVEPLNRKTYQAQMEVASLGCLSLARISTSGAKISRRNEDVINLDFKRFSFVIVLSGEMILSYHHGVTELRAGQFLFIDNTYSRSMLVQKDISLLVISLPGVVLRRYFPEVEQLEGVVVKSQNRENSEDISPYSFILDRWEKIHQGSLRDSAPLLTHKLLKQLAACYKINEKQSQNKRVERISHAKVLIEERLACPGFTVEALAGELKVSSRYLRALFSGSEKLSHYLMRRRLEVCAQRLVSEDFADKIITEIAYSCGFCNIAHFSRSFKKHYQITPREYRKVYLKKIDHPRL